MLSQRSSLTDIENHRICCLHCACDSLRSSLCSSSPATPDFADLPQHIATLILSKIEAEEGTAAAATIRLVSKSWHAAFNEFAANEFAARVQMKGDKPDQLKALCQLLPHTREVFFNKASKRLDLDWTAQLSFLTALTIWHDRSEKPYEAGMGCALSNLPTRLRELCLDGVHLLLEPVNNVDLPLLTSLQFAWKPNIPSNAWSLLLCLPALKVSHLESFCANTKYLRNSLLESSLIMIKETIAGRSCMYCCSENEVGHEPLRCTAILGPLHSI